MKKPKVLYQINSPETVYAARFIYEGYKAAFLDKGYEFEPYTSSDNLKDKLEEFAPDLFITSLNRYNLKFLDLKLLKEYRQRGLVMFTQIMPWEKHSQQMGGEGLKNDRELLNLIKEGLAGDIFYHWMDNENPEMKGFSKETGYPLHTILLAANTKLFYPDFDQRYEADISFVGSLLPTKKEFIKTHLLPLKEKYNVRTYGSDWTWQSRLLGIVQKGGQYLNIKPLKGIRKIPLSLEDERKVYNSSTISLNIHENHQRKLGTDFNERTFKIIASGGFQISDYISGIRKYFTESELVMAADKKDWFEKIDYYLGNPEKRLPIIEKGRKKVLEQHTYHNRVDQFVDLYHNFKS